MKRKLFTLLLAFVALATFQANAQKVWVHTGDSVSEWNTYGLLPTPAIDSKLTFVPGAGTTPGSFVYKAGETPSYSTYDKITVSNPAVNYVDFKYGEQTLELAYGGVTYNRFVVWIDNPLGFNIQSFNNGLFEGYLSVQTGSSVTDNDLLLVVHNAAGVLSLRPYSQVFASQAPGASVRYYPLYVRTYPLSGRWATAADFEGCKFNQFKYDGTALSVYEAAATSTGFGTKAYDVFTVSQVDWVKNPSEGVQSNNNIFGTTGFNATPDFAYAGRPTSSGNANYGTELVGTLHYIPLFTLSSPENSCKVLSVSRKNDLKTQNEGEGGYANKLELRTYNRFFDWRLAGSPATYQYAQRTPASGDFGTTSLSDAQRVATSLQKFAIWINDDGEFILYPAATYFWKYGEEKDAVNTTNQQPNKVVANAVLLYNDTKISAELGTTQDVRKSQGIQIGWYDGTSAGQPTKPGYIATIPNVLHTWTSYEARPFEIGCVAEDKDISGRFYFLQVYPDTTGTYALDRAAFYTTGGYQVAREYVLSVQLSADKLSKHLVAVPKEKVLTTEAEYWRFPYDSVNMAAHWEVQAVKDALGNIESYRFINMLGDTLQYDGAGAALSGGYLPENGLITGSVDPTEGPFGRPYDIIPNYTWAGAHKWFDKNLSNPTTTASKNEWVLHQLKSPYKFGSPERANAFYMQLKGQNLALQYNTAIWYHGDNSIGVGLGASKTTYYQKDVDLAPLPTGLQTYAWNTLPSCVGLLISLEPIYYVPTKEIYLGTNSDDGIINTGGKNASTGELIPSKFLKQDSLTAYTFLNGTFSIKEATAVDNSLVLGYTPNIPTYDGSRTANVARLISSTSAEKLQFIPIASTNRTQLLKQLATDAGIATLNEIDYLYGEYYKWYVVKSGNYYLTFDTVNLQATTNRGKVGLTFDATDLANALPVRLYQPLVGDKAQDNFLFQFYLPKYSYYPNATLPANRAGANKFPDIESATLSTPTSGWIPGGRGVVYATLGQQSNYIHATRAFNGLATGTRFTLALEGPPETCCPTEFIDPQWMGANRLLSLPLNNRIWVEKIPVDAWIANGAGSPVPAIVNNDTTTQGTTLTHTYATSIKKWDIGDTQQWVRLSNNADGLTLGSAPGTTAATYTPIGSGTSPIPAATNFEDDLEVPLYYIQNEAGLYLTVTANNDMRDDAATNSDVNGIQLQWLPQYIYQASYGYNQRALQLFAISGCKGEEDGWYGKFIYLPLASFKTNYKTGKVDSTSYAITGGTVSQPTIYYNVNLGKSSTAICAINDVTKAWRISQFARVQDNVKKLVVFNAQANDLSGSLVPIEFKLTKQEYLKLPCDYLLVKNANNRTSVDKGRFYTFDNSIADAGVNSLAAHWHVTYDPDKTGDDFLIQFNPELKKLYDKAYETDGVTVAPTKLTGDYYAIKVISGDIVNGPVTVRVIDVSGYGNSNFTAVYDTLTVSCVNHNLPFFNLETLAKNVSTLSVAALETPFKDRNLTYVDENGNPAPIIRTNWDKHSPFAYQTFIKQLDLNNNFADAEYLKVYQENKRYLSDAKADVPDDSVHMIPYYSFSITKDGKEYFLNIDEAFSTSRADSVYWTELSLGARDSLVQWQKYPNYLPKYKFCLPYKVDAAGVKEQVDYNGQKLSSVYLQTLDLGRYDYPYLVIAGSATKYVTARKLDDALKGINIVDKSLDWNIYTVDYTKIDPVKVTSWILGGQVSQGFEWVPLTGSSTVVGNTTTGVLTDYLIGGATFINESAQTPVNYGIITGLGNAPELTFVYEGDTTIGQILPKQIWYYKIAVAANKYLTDSRGAHIYNYSGLPFDLAYFTTKKTDQPYLSEGVGADTNFAQTFGFWYVKDKSLIGGKDAQAVDVQAFYVVSNADYKANDGAYRFLSEVNNHLVFVNDLKDALIFQYGKIAGGNYTDIEVVGKSGIFAVDGGVRVLEGSGKVDLYTIDGRLIKSAVISGADQTIAAPKGVVIVKNGSKVVKVVVK